MKKLTLLLLGIINVIGIGLISPVMTDFAKDFPTLSDTSIAMVVTTPAITLLLGLAVSAWLVNTIQRKNLLLLGISCAVVGGVLPAFLNNFNLILIARGLLGFGMGLGMPLQTTFFAEYPENERATLFGLNTGLGALISTSMLFLIALLTMTWRNTFLLYGLFIIVLLCVLFFIPYDQPKETTLSQTPKSHQRSQLVLPIQLIFGYIAIFFIYAQYFIIPTTIAFYLASNQLGGVIEAGFISGIGTLVMAVASVSFPYLRKWLKKWLTTVTLLIGALAFIIYAFPVNIGVLTFGYCVTTMISAIFPITITMKITESLPQKHIAVASAIFTSIIYLGQFLSPYYQALIVKLAGGNIEGAYIAFGIIVLILAVIDMILVRKQTN